MAKNPKTPLGPTKKHLARAERERMQTRYILIGSAVVIVLVLATLLYGILEQSVLVPGQPVAVVNGERINTRDFQGQVRYGRYSVIREASNTLQFMQLFGSDPSTLSMFAGQLFQVETQMQSEVIGQDVLDQMINNALIRQEAARRGIKVTGAEVEKRFEEAFGFFPEGTPTPTATNEPIPTSTLSPLQMTASAPTATPAVTATPVITATEEVTATPDSVDATATPEAAEPTAPAGEATPTAIPSPTATATPYTLEGYKSLYKETVDNLKKQYNITEADLRYTIENQIYREKVMEAVLSEMEISRTQEQVWARHILVADDAAAQVVRDRLNKGEEWCALAAEVSTDSSNKDRCGDLNWFARERMDPAFSEAAFAMPVGEISEPVQSASGWHVIQVLGHEDRPLSDSEYLQQRDTKFREWLEGLRAQATIDTKEYWAERVPADPALPAEMQQTINQLKAQLNQQQQQQFVLPTEEPAP